MLDHLISIADIICLGWREMDKKVLVGKYLAYQYVTMDPKKLGGSWMSIFYVISYS